MSETIRFRPCCRGRAVVGCASLRRKGQGPLLSPYVALVCFPIIFLGELPDKTMFATLLMATRGRPVQVWIGAALAFLAHVAIAVTVGVALFAVLPHRAVDALVAVAFLAGALYAWRLARSDDESAEISQRSARSALATAFLVIFAAEWGDLTQILTADLAARYGAPLSVAVGSVAALWAVAAIAVTSGQAILRLVNPRRVRQVTAVILLGLAAYATWAALR